MTDCEYGCTDGRCRATETGHPRARRLKVRLRLAIALWHAYYRLLHLMRPDESWERDVALSANWSRGFIRLKISVTAAILWVLGDRLAAPWEGPPF